MPLAFNNPTVTSTLNRLARPRREKEDMDAANQLVTRLSTQARQAGGDTRSDFLQAPSAHGQSVGVDGDALRTQSTLNTTPPRRATSAGAAETPAPTVNARPQVEVPDAEGKPIPDTPPVFDLPPEGGGKTKPHRPAYGEDEDPPLPPGDDAGDGAGPGDGAGGGDGGGGGGDPESPGGGEDNTPPPNEPYPDDGGEEEFVDDLPVDDLPDDDAPPEIAGLSELAALLVHRLNQPDPYSEEDIQRIRDYQAGERQREREQAFGGLDLNAARRGVFHSSIPVAGRARLEEGFRRAAEAADLDLLQMVSEARERRQSTAVQEALQLLGLGQTEQQTANALAIAAAQLGMHHGIDPNSLLAALMGQGGGGAANSGSYDLLYTLLGSYFGGGG